jgi:hypothetical protein
MKSFLKSRTAMPQLCAAATLLGLSLGAGLSHAAQSTVSVTSFSWVTSGGTLSWSDPYQSFEATAMNGGGLSGSKTDAFETPDWGFLTVGASTANAIASVATTTPQTFFSNSSAATSIGPPGTLRNQASSIANQAGTFTLSSAGSVTFTVDYTLNVNAPGGSATTDYAGASASFAAWNSANTSGGNRTDSLTSFSQLSGMGSKNGRFNFTVNLTAGESGFYSLDGNATAFAQVVPEPAEWALMSGGLLAMSAFIRRRKQAVVA